MSQKKEKNGRLCFFSSSFLHFCFLFSSRRPLSLPWGNARLLLSLIAFAHPFPLSTPAFPSLAALFSLSSSSAFGYFIAEEEEKGAFFSQRKLPEPTSFPFFFLGGVSHFSSPLFPYLLVFLLLD